MLAGWNKIDSNFTQNLQSSYPLDAPGSELLSDLDETFFSTSLPELGSAFMYDAVMSVGKCGRSGGVFCAAVLTSCVRNGDV